MQGRFVLDRCHGAPVARSSDGGSAVRASMLRGRCLSERYTYPVVTRTETGQK